MDVKQHIIKFCTLLRMRWSLEILSISISSVRVYEIFKCPMDFFCEYSYYSRVLPQTVKTQTNAGFSVIKQCGLLRGKMQASLGKIIIGHLLLLLFFQSANKNIAESDTKPVDPRSSIV